jgi:syndecan 4
MYVRSSQDDNYVGFIFGYVNNRKFYMVSWRPNNYNFDTTSYKGGIKGVHIAVSRSYQLNLQGRYLCWWTIMNKVPI